MSTTGIGWLVLIAVAFCCWSPVAGVTCFWHYVIRTRRTKGKIIRAPTTKKPYKYRDNYAYCDVDYTFKVGSNITPKESLLKLKQLVNKVNNKIVLPDAIVELCLEFIGVDSIKFWYGITYEKEHNVNNELYYFCVNKEVSVEYCIANPNIAGIDHCPMPIEEEKLLKLRAITVCGFLGLSLMIWPLTVFTDLGIVTFIVIIASWIPGCILTCCYAGLLQEEYGFQYFGSKRKELNVEIEKDEVYGLQIV